MSEPKLDTLYVLQEMLKRRVCACSLLSIQGKYLAIITVRLPEGNGTVLKTFEAYGNDLGMAILGVLAQVRYWEVMGHELPH